MVETDIYDANQAPTERKQRTYKIEVGDIIKIKRQDFQNSKGHYIFYKTIIPKKEKGTSNYQYYTKNLRFKSGTDIPDGTSIKIKSMFEDCWHNKNDKFNDCWGLFIMDYDVIAENGNNTNPYSNAADAINLTDSDLPF